MQILKWAGVLTLIVLDSLPTPLFSGAPPEITLGIPRPGVMADQKRAAFSPDGKFFTLVSLDLGVSVWESATGRLLQVLKTDVDSDTTVSMGVRYVAIAQYRRVTTVEFYDWRRGKLISTVTDEESELIPLDFSTPIDRSADGKILAVGFASRVQIFDFEKPAWIASLPESQSSIALSPDGTKLATIDSESSTVSLWEVRSRKLLFRRDSVQSEFTRPTIARFSPLRDEVSWCNDNNGILYVAQFFPNGGIAISERFIDGLNNFTYDEKGTRWISDKQGIAVLPEGNLPIDYYHRWGKDHGTSFGPRGRILHFSGLAAEVMDDYGKQRQRRYPFSAENSTSHRLVLSPNGSHLLTQNMGHAVKLWDLASGSLVTDFSPTPNDFSSFRFLTDEYVQILRNHALETWTIRGGTFPKQKAPLGPMYTESFFSPNGEWTIYAGASHLDISPFVATKRSETSYFAFWNHRTGRVFEDMGHPPIVPGSVVFSSADPSLVAFQQNASPIIFDLRSEKEIARFESISSKPSMAFTRDGKSLATLTGSRIELWSLSEHKITQTLKTSAAEQILLAPGNRLATYGRTSGRIEIWNVATGKRDSVFESGLAGIASIAFSGNGSTVAIAGFDTTIHIWPFEIVLYGNP